MKILLLLVVFLAPSFSYGQQQKDSNDSKVMDEVFVFTKQKKKKVKIYKTDGWPAFKNLNQHDRHVNLFNDYPKGKLNYVEFYFNTGMVNMMKNKLDINYQDVEVQLLIYKVKDDRLIGESLLPVDYKFIVGKEHNGAYRINLSEFNIQETQLFIGIAVVGKTNAGETNIYVRMHEKKDAIGYEQHAFYPGWHSLLFKETFKLRLGIEE